MHTPSIKKFKRSQTIVNSIDESWQIDLIDVNNLKNKKISQYYAYLFTCIDALSKYAFVEPIKNKTSEETKRVFKKIIETSNRIPKYLY